MVRLRVWNFWFRWIWWDFRTFCEVFVIGIFWRTVLNWHIHSCSIMVWNRIVFLGDWLCFNRNLFTLHGDLERDQVESWGWWCLNWDDHCRWRMSVIIVEWSVCFGVTTTRFTRWSVWGPKGRCTLRVKIMFEMCYINVQINEDLFGK